MGTCLTGGPPDRHVAGRLSNYLGEHCKITISTATCGLNLGQQNLQKWMTREQMHMTRNDDRKVATD